MHGLINRAIQAFICDSYGVDVWAQVAQRADLGFAEFEAMLRYDADLTETVLGAAASQLGRARAELLEDIGTYLVSHPNVEALRRLLRFGGVDFVEFLHSLDDLPDRARLAVADLDLPRLELRDHTAHEFSLRVGPELPGFGHVMLGVLRAMADDYGALVILDQDSGPTGDVIAISLVASDYATGRRFDLGARSG